MPSIYTPISLEQMTEFLNNNYHCFCPQNTIKQGGEHVFSLSLDPSVVINVWTSIHQGKEACAKSGSDSIKLTLNSAINGRPLIAKQSIVKRTQNWKNSLFSRMQEILSVYFEDAEGIQAKAQESKPSSRFASEKQINFALRLMNRMSDNEFVSLFKRGKPSQNELEKMTSKDVSILIDSLQ